MAAELARLGPINPLALEELSTLEERHELETQTDDVRLRRELRGRRPPGDRRDVRLGGATDVNDTTRASSSTLFPGGTRRLVLTEPEEILDAGVDIEIRPGRTQRAPGLLALGRGTVALRVGVPVRRVQEPSRSAYLMDEVEAASTTSGPSRFLDMVTSSTTRRS